MAMLNVTTHKKDLRKNSSASLWRESSFETVVHAPEMDQPDDSDDPNRKPSHTPTPADHEQHFLMSVGGKSFRFRSDVVLSCRQDSLLSTLIRAEHEQRLMIFDDFNERTGEYYLERNSSVASAVLEYFVTGRLHKPLHVCPERFTEELKFWRLYDVEFATCCAPALSVNFGRKKDLSEEEQEFDGVCCSPTRLFVYRTMEDPSSSVLAKCFSVVSVVFIFVSIIGLILGSMPEFQRDSRFANAYHVYHKRPSRSDKFDEAKGENNLAALNLTGWVYRPTDDPHPSLVLLENICIAWFTFEYLIRLIVAPRKRKFVAQTMNVIDLLTVLPVYIELILFQLGIYADQLKEFTAALLVVRILRVLRIARVVKLARYSSGLQIFGQTLRTSITELSMLLVFLLTGTIFFSTIIYFVENRAEYSDFRSIPAASWWCIITITTVGYGDAHVQTTLGKVVATSAAIAGIIILAFPVSLIVENFAQAQHMAHVENQMRQAQISAASNNLEMKRGHSRRRRPADGNQAAGQKSALVNHSRNVQMA
ncbi:Potassium voltage-gated channel subfamily B member 1 [Aphelenchoides fujianensis]|nr:Potassium voltage-gated channel subfamily B member 1 [Aphelenchoides fujianensis]